MLQIGADAVAVNPGPSTNVTGSSFCGARSSVGRATSTTRFAGAAARPLSWARTEGKTTRASDASSRAARAESRRMQGPLRVEDAHQPSPKEGL